MGLPCYNFWMNLLRKILENPIGMIVISCFLIVFNSYPAFVLFGGEVFSIRDSLPFLLTADFSALLIMFGIPFLIIKFVFNKRLENFGLCKPLDLTRAVKLSSFVVLLLIPFLYFLANQASFREYYAIKQGFSLFFLVATLGSGLYYFAEEFIFRGFLFFGLWERLRFHSFWVINLIFALFHISKPVPEVFLAFFSGLLLTYLSYKTKSFIPSVAVHFTIALILNIFVIISQ